jgi:phospholipase/carboxylesterase
MSKLLLHLTRPPTNPAPNTKPSLLILLHGYGSNEADLFSFASLLNEKFIVLSPRAPRNLMPNAYAWFDLGFQPDGSLTHASEQVLAARDQLIAFVRESIIAYKADPTRVYLLGFSQGAMMSALVALTEPNLVAGAVMMSGLIPDEVKSLIAPPHQLDALRLFVGHGTQDEVVPIAQGRAAHALLTAHHISHEYREYPIGHHFSDDSLDDILGWLDEKLGG